MPKEWYDKHSIHKIEDDDKRELYYSIAADKKPYFMRYIYPPLMKKYNTYIKNTNRNALREFQMTVPELRSLPYEKLSDRQKEFLRFYDKRMPVGVHDCVMNKICKRFEKEFDGFIGKQASSGKFDYEMLKNDAEYTLRQRDKVKRLYDDYNKRLKSYMVFASYERVDEYDALNALAAMNDDFQKECTLVCPNELALCNIVLDICYSKSSTKRFAWSMSGKEIIHSLLVKNNGHIFYPALDECGDIDYCGNKFKMKRVEVKGEEE